MYAGGRCRFVQRKISAGELLFEQGDVPSEVTFVQKGTVALTAKDASGASWWNGVRGPRSLIGIEAIQGRPARAKAQVVTDSEICSADPIALKVQLDASAAGGLSEVAAALLPLLLDELDRRSEEMQGRSGSALARVARFILEHSEVVAGGQRGPFSKRHVASMLGIRPETMSRCLAALTREGVITADRTVTVNDRARLEAIASTPHGDEAPSASKKTS
jgi:CRP-like cAMP-binding protein